MKHEAVTQKEYNSDLIIDCTNNITAYVLINKDDI
jgi:hypothetical protein